MSVAAISALASEQFLWNDYVRSPTQLTYQSLVDSIASCSEARSCDASLAPTVAQNAALRLLLDKKAPYAVDVAFLALPLLDGGELEDMLIALGQFADHKDDAVLLLQGVKKRPQSQEELRSLLLMVPPSTYDDDKARVATIRKRIRNIESIRNRSLQEERQRSLSILREYLQELTKK